MNPQFKEIVYTETPINERNHFEKKTYKSERGHPHMTSW
jgi:hypothetical protein